MMNENWLGLDGQVVIVTGGASGIGKHVVDTLVKVGANAVAVDLNVKTGDELDGAYCVQCNVTDPESVNQMVQAGGGRGADIHAGPLPDGFQAFQHLNFRCVVLVGRVHRSGVQQFIFCHAGSPFRIFISVPRQEEPGRSRLRPVSPCPEPCKLESNA